MKEFVLKHAAAVIGVLSGFDRLVFRGTLRNMAFAEGLMRYLNVNRILLKDAGRHFEAVSERVKAASVRVAERAQRPLIYLPSGQTSKEGQALEVARRDGIRAGLLCVLSSVEPCQSFEIHRNRERRRLELRSCTRKCLHYYHYWLHPQLGLLHARLQTWFPFTLQVCLNGREWLACALTRKGVAYDKSDNCFRWLADVRAAQRCADAQLKTDWPGLLNALARRVNPLWPDVFGRYETEYYWSAHQTEWATDVMFKTPALLKALYGPLVRHGITTFQSPDVMRFLGQRVMRTGREHGNFKGAVVSDLKRRPEGLRLKHRLGRNSVKVYDKQGSVLRVETTIHDASSLKVFRPVEGAPTRKLKWRKLRKGVADLHRRAKLSQACNERYLSALALVEDEETLGPLLGRICRPLHGARRRARGLQPFGQDAGLLAEIGRGAYALAGFRNRDLQGNLWSSPPADAIEKRRRAAQTSRTLRLLRAHRLVRKAPKSYRYHLTRKGRALVVALGAANLASIKKLSELAA